TFFGGDSPCRFRVLCDEPVEEQLQGLVAQFLSGFSDEMEGTTFGSRFTRTGQSRWRSTTTTDAGSPQSSAREPQDVDRPVRVGGRQVPAVRGEGDVIYRARQLPLGNFRPPRVPEDDAVVHVCRGNRLPRWPKGHCADSCPVPPEAHTLPPGGRLPE